MAATAIIVDIYCRVSSDDQEDNTSLEEQEAICRKFCKEHGLYVGLVHHFKVPALRLDAAVWAMVSQLADHVALLEQSIELAMKNHTVEDDLRAVEVTLADWQAKIANYEEDLQDSSLRSDTRHGIRNLLNNAYEMVERLGKDRAELETFSIDRDRERAEYDKILAWCKKAKQDREELTYTEKRDFLRALGVTVYAARMEQRGGEPVWDFKVRLPQIEEVIYQGRLDAIGGHFPRKASWTRASATM